MEKFNPTDWLNKFRIASLNKLGFRELRKEIFKYTIKVVNNGGYYLDRKLIPISNDGVTQETVYFSYPPKLEFSKKNIKPSFQLLKRTV